MIRKATINDLQNVSDVHKICFPNSFLTILCGNGKLLQKFYYQYLLSADDLFFVCEENNTIVGFCIGYYCDDANQKKTFIKKHWLYLSIRIFVLAITFNKNFYKRLFRKSSKEQIIVKDQRFYSIERRDKGDLLSICVLPNYRGRHISHQLIDAFEESLIKCGRHYSQLTVERNNEVAINAYMRKNYIVFSEDSEYLRLYKRLDN